MWLFQHSAWVDFLGFGPQFILFSPVFSKGELECTPLEI